MTVRIRQSAVSGLFYPGERETLASEVRELLGSVAATPAPALGAIAPHAGYIYSGRTAAEVFARLELPARCIVIAPNHTGLGTAPRGGSLYATGSFLTPMGEVPVDEALAAALLERCPLLADDPAAHLREHAVEVELPFLLARRPDVAIVPIVLGWGDWPRSLELAEAVAEVVAAEAEPVFLLASSDMNHYQSAAVGEAKDRRALAEVERLDGEALLEVTDREHITMCGRAPTAVVLAASRALGATRAEVVDYSHSGMVSGDMARVVGYAGVVVR